MLNQIIEIGKFMVGAYAHAWPYLLVTIPLAVLVNVSGISKYIGKTFNAKPLVAIFLATVVGAFSPFCSCGVIPVITALLIGGVPLAPVMSFWLASPSMDPEVFFLSASQLGMDLAVWRLAGTFAMSLAGGYITHFLIRIKWLGTDVMKLKSSKKSGFTFNNPLKLFKSRFIPVPAAAACTAGGCSAEKSVPAPETESAGSFSEKQSCDCSAADNPAQEEFPSTGCGCSAPDSPEQDKTSSTGCGCNTDSISSSENNKNNSIGSRIFNESKNAVFMILKFMTLAFFLEAIIILYLPEEWIISILGKDNIFAIPLSAFIGIPLYTTNLTALGLMGGLLNQGMNPGAALAFLIGGATTTVPAMAAVYGIVKKRVFLLYVSFALGAALFTGYLYQIVNMFIY